jgi:hypothetical protein
MLSDWCQQSRRTVLDVTRLLLDSISEGRPFAVLLAPPQGWSAVGKLNGTMSRAVMLASVAGPRLEADTNGSGVAPWTVIGEQDTNFAQVAVG